MGLLKFGQHSLLRCVVFPIGGFQALRPRGDCLYKLGEELQRQAKQSSFFEAMERLTKGCLLESLDHGAALALA